MMVDLHRSFWHADNADAELQLVVAPVDPEGVDEA